MRASAVTVWLKNCRKRQTGKCCATSRTKATENVIAVLDTNILVYAHRRDSALLISRRCQPHQGTGRRLGTLGDPVDRLHEFWLLLRILESTDRRHPSPPPAIRSMRALESPASDLLTETTQHWPTLRALLNEGRVTGPRVHDARIAAFMQAVWRHPAVVGGSRFRPLWKRTGGEPVDYLKGAVYLP